MPRYFITGLLHILAYVIFGDKSYAQCLGGITQYKRYKLCGL